MRPRAGSAPALFLGEGRPGKAGKDRHVAHLAPEKSRKLLRQSVFFRRTGLYFGPKNKFWRL
jgi:hypothetical protein